jgi:acetyl-CoA acetyltransferase
MTHVYVVDGVRTPQGRYGGALAAVRPDDLAALALGHPLGCSGARLVVTLLGRMEREQAGRALATLCVGAGQGAALALEAP